MKTVFLKFFNWILLLFVIIVLVGCDSKKDVYYIHLNDYMDIYIKYDMENEVIIDNQYLTSYYEGYSVEYKSNSSYVDIVNSRIKIKSYPSISTTISITVTFTDVIHEDISASRDVNVYLMSNKENKTREFVLKKDYTIVDYEEKVIKYRVSDKHYTVGTYEYHWEKKYEYAFNEYILIIYYYNNRYSKNLVIEGTYNVKTGSLIYSVSKKDVDKKISNYNLRNTLSKEEIEEIPLEVYEGIKLVDDYLIYVGEQQYCSSLYR